MKKNHNPKNNISIKEPRTIKVKTVVIMTIWFITLIVALISGWFLRSYDNLRVSNEAQSMIQMSKENQ